MDDAGIPSELPAASTNWHLEHVHPDPIRGEPHFTYQMVPDRPDRPDRDSGDRHQCELETVRFIEVYAQTIQEPGPMDPALRARTVACLDDADIPSKPGDTTAEEIFLTAGTAHKNDVADCMLDAYSAEFPDRPQITVGIPPEVSGFDPSGLAPG